MTAKRSGAGKLERSVPLHDALRQIPSAHRQRMWAVLPVRMQPLVRRIEALLRHAGAGALPLDRHELLLEMARFEQRKASQRVTHGSLAQGIVDGLPFEDAADGNRYVRLAADRSITEERAVRLLTRAYGRWRTALLEELSASARARQLGENAADLVADLPGGHPILETAAHLEAAARKLRNIWERHKDSPEKLERLQHVPAAAVTATEVQAVTDGFRKQWRRSKPTS